MAVVLDKPVRLNIFSAPSHLPVVRAALEKLCQLMGFDARCTGGIVLSTDEALTNIIRHAYQGAEDQPIEVELSPLGEADGLRIRLRDYGRQVDPATIKSRELSDIRPGGLGVHIMNKCMDSLEYTRAPGGGTVLTMVKRLPAAKEDSRT